MYEDMTHDLLDLVPSMQGGLVISDMQNNKLFAITIKVSIIPKIIDWYNEKRHIVFHSI